MTATRLKVRIYGDPCLRKKALVVTDIGPAERILIHSMFETMHAEKGIGLAAPQVGISQRILVVDTGEGPFAVINPEILSKSGSDVMEEGCLSLPGVTVNVRRALKIRVRYWDENNSKHERNFEGLRARVIQHETDHLNGKLIVDYAGLAEKLKLNRKLKDLEATHQKIS